jgi:hypothetical protein
MPAAVLLQLLCAERCRKRLLRCCCSCWESLQQPCCVLELAWVGYWGSMGAF